MWSAINNVVTGCAPLTDWTGTKEEDLGSGGFVSYRYNTIGTTDVTFGVTTGTTNDTALLGVALAESASATDIPVFYHHYKTMLAGQ
jgi:hypothetical protein